MSWRPERSCSPSAGWPRASILAFAGAAVSLIGFGSVGMMVLAETDEEWEHTPEIEGFRALPGM